MDVQEILTRAQDAMTGRRVFGEPIQLENVTVIPAAMVQGGGGGGGKNTEQGGVGFGLKAKPVGVYVVRNGDVVWRPALDVNRIILGAQVVAVTALVVMAPLIQRWVSRSLQRSR
jgi:uncharacterized spore protein YtfJ